MESAKNPKEMSKRGRGTPKAAYFILIIIVLAIGYYLLAGQAGQSYLLNTNKTFAMAAGSSIYFSLPNSNNKFSLFLQNSTTLGSVVYISGTPILAQPIIVLSLFKGQLINVSSTGSGAADISIGLLSASNGNASIELTPIPKGLGIRASGNVRVINPGSFTQSGPVKSNVNYTTTTTTSSSTTTTAIVVNHVLQAIQIANNTPIGILMGKDNKLYVKDIACASDPYNTTLSVVDHLPPTGPYSFVNISRITPVGVNMTVSAMANNVYQVNYITVTSGNLRGQVVGIAVNTQSSAVINTTYATGLSYSLLNNTYNFQNGISGFCGTLIPYFGH